MRVPLADLVAICSSAALIGALLSALAAVRRARRKLERRRNRDPWMRP